MATTGIPVIDCAEALAGGDATAAATAIDAACREHGFFVVTGHGIDPDLFATLDQAARDFFARPAAEKERIAMARAGAAWRGWFPPGGELTGGVPDGKDCWPRTTWGVSRCARRAAGSRRRRCRTPSCATSATCSSG